jgi:predicted dehydrogenase
MQRTVVLGAGHWHLPLYRDAFVERHQVVGVWDADTDAVSRAADDLGATGYDTVAESLTAPKAHAGPVGLQVRAAWQLSTHPVKGGRRD